jgi:hypothetical protein
MEKPILLELQQNLVESVSGKKQLWALQLIKMSFMKLLE